MLPARGRSVGGTVETTWEAIAAALRPLVQDDKAAQEVMSAFYDVVWVPSESGYPNYEEAAGQPGCFSCSWRTAGTMVAELRGLNETYMDWIWEAESGQVSARVLEAMAALGLRPVTD